MKIQRILVIKGGSQYGQLRYEADEIVRGFCAQGRLVTVLDLNSDAHRVMKKGWIHDYDMIFTFNAIGINLYTEEKAENKPILWSFHVDHPFYHSERIDMVKDRVIMSFIDRRHVEYADRFYKNVPWVCFMPHGGIIGESQIIPYKDRKYNVVLMGSLGNIRDTVAQIAEYRSSFGDLIDAVLGTVEKDNNVDLEVVVSEKLLSFGIKVEDLQFKQIMSGLYPIDIYRRYLKRRNLVDAVCRAGIVIDIWGNGWQEVAEKMPGMIRLHENVPYDSIKQIMSEARIVLNDMPLFHEGSHERVFAPMQCGAVCLTDKSIFTEECFEDMRDIVYYDANKPDEVPEKIEYLLGDPETAETISRNGREASTDHTWVIRAAEVLEIAEGLE